jgi:hypothetical protein
MEVSQTTVGSMSLRLAFRRERVAEIRVALFMVMLPDPGAALK